MKIRAILFLPAILLSVAVSGQVKIGDNPASISPGSILELESTSKALALPRMTTVQMQAIPSPLKGMIVFNIDSNCIYLYKNENVWASLTTNAAPAQAWPYQSSDLTVGTPGNAKGIIALTGNGLTASGIYSHAEGANSVAAGEYSLAFGLGDTAVNNGSAAMGQQNKAAGLYSFALGFKNITGYQAAMAFGQENQDSGWASLTMGLRNRINNGTSYSNALGYLNQVNSGSANTLSGESNLIAGGRANTGAGYANIFNAPNFSSAFGTGNDVLAGNSHIVAGENNTIKSGNANSLFGQNNFAEGSYLGSIGKDNIVYYQSAVALGQGNKDSGYASIAGGINNTIRSGVQYSTSMGNSNQVIAGTANTVLGQGNTLTNGIANSLLGYNNMTEANYNTIGGNLNKSINGSSNSIFGENNFGDGFYLGAMGKDNIVYYQSAVALGQGNKDSGYASISAGLNNVIKSSVQYSSVLGSSNIINGGSSNTALGEANIIHSGRANNAQGYSNIITANFSSLFGTGNQVLMGNSHISGGENNNIKSGNANSVFGQSNIADGSYLGAIGRDNIVYFQSGVALGQNNRDSGWASLAAGFGNIVENNVRYSVALGQSNVMTKNPSPSFANSGTANFSAGISNINSGYASIALGGNTRPTNAYSLSANYNTISNSHAMSAFGHFNDTLPALQGASYEGTEMLFAIGNGINNAGRRNSFTMLRNGFTSINTTPETGVNTPRAELDVKGTGAIIVPVGTSAQRPATPVTGMIRFCTDCAGGPVLQGYDGTTWVNL